jgi:PTH1 family peptidyl-tRNA hydrolase
MKFLICGLGNPGTEYEHTRHNIGFSVLDSLAHANQAVFESVRYGSMSNFKLKGRNIILLKPNTYMNLSGKAIQYWMQAEKVPLENVLVITDDLALPFGSLRMRTKGSDGGHNGLKSTQECLGTTNYARLRFGIGSEFAKGHQVNYVLNKWNADEDKALPERLNQCCEFIKSFATIGPTLTMSQFNNK